MPTDGANQVSGYDGDYAGEAALTALYGPCDTPAQAVLSVSGGRVHYQDAVNGTLDGYLPPGSGGIVQIRSGGRLLTGRIVGGGFAGNLSGAICDYAYRFRRVTETVAQDATSPDETRSEYPRTEAAASDEARDVAPVAPRHRQTMHADPTEVSTVLARLRRSLANEADGATASASLAMPAAAHRQAPATATVHPIDVAPTGDTMSGSDHSGSGGAAPATLAGASPDRPAGSAPASDTPPASEPPRLQTVSLATAPGVAATALPGRTSETQTASLGMTDQDFASPGFAPAQALALGRKAPEEDNAAATVMAAAVPALRQLANRPGATAQGVAQYDLGYCYEHGIGLATDKLRAYVYYIRASVAPAGSAAANAAFNDTDVAKAALKGAEGLQATLTASDYSAAIELLRQGAP